MVKTQNTIEINGKHYDATTGALVGEAHPSQPEKIKKGAVMDGFVRRKSSTEHSIKHHKRFVQKANTLMRQAVKKPTTATTHTKNGTTNHQDIGGDRLRRAHGVPKSPLISRFSFNEVVSIVKKVNPQNNSVKASQPENKPTHTKTPSHHAHQATSQKVTRVSSNDLVEKALIKAQSHSQAPHRVKKIGRLASRLGLSRKKSTLVSGILSVLLLGTFFAYQNVPNFAMRVAAARAGFDANMPSYQPSGFSFKSPIKYSPGEVIVSFNSNTSDGRAFTLTERKTDWTSDDLRANFVQKQDSSHQTILEANQVVYTYGDGDAAWVDDGIWYQLDSSASLTWDQIVRIAQSL